MAAGVGYEIAGMVGILLCGAVVYGLTWVLRVRQAGEPESAAASAAAVPTVRRDANGHIGWLEHTLSGIRARSSGRSSPRATPGRRLAAGIDPRAKLAMFLTVILAASLSGLIAVLIGLYAVILVVAAASRMPFDVLRRARLARDSAVRRARRRSRRSSSCPARACSRSSLGRFVIAPSIPRP